MQQSNQNNLDEKKHILSDLNSTLLEGGPDDEITQDELLRGSGKDTAPGPEKVRYSHIKNRTEARTEVYAICPESFDKGHIPKTGHTAS